MLSNVLTCKQHTGIKSAVIKLALERLSEILPEVEELWRLHFQETEGYRHALGYNPDKEGFLAYDRTHMFRLYTARDGGRLVGQLGFIVFRSRHTQTRTAGEDFFYVRHEHRGAGVARELMDFALSDLRAEDVDQVTFSDKQPSDLEPFLKKFGFKFVSKQYSLVLREV